MDDSDRKAQWLEDLPLDRPIDCGSFRLSEQEIIDFAKQYDPQPFHVSREAAAASIFGGLVASSAQTLAISCGMMVRAVAGVQLICGVAWEDIRLDRPVRPDRDYRVVARWTSARPSASKPDRGIARMAIAVLEGEATAVSYAIPYLVRRRPSGG